ARNANRMHSAKPHGQASTLDRGTPSNTTYSYTMTPRFIVGCMTGTSLDGLDAALAVVHGRGLEMTAKLAVVASQSLGKLRDELRHFAAGGAAEPLRYLRAARRLGELHADAVEALCQKEGVRGLDFVVAHGQTIWHVPPPGEGLSWQLMD